MAEIKVLNGNDAGRKFNIEDGKLIVGRGSDCDIQISDSGISRHHAILQFKGDSWFLKDLNSQNGIFIENRRQSIIELSADCTVKVGTVDMFFSPTVDACDQFITADTDTGTNTLEPAKSKEVPEAEKESTIPPLKKEEKKISVEQIENKQFEPTQDKTKTSKEIHKQEKVETVELPPLIKEPTQAVSSSLPTIDETIVDIREMSDIYKELEKEFSKVIIGQRTVLEELLVAIAAGGHCLMVGLPGLAKTLMVRTLSGILQLKFKRIQFTPDLMPSDIIGTDVLEINESTGEKIFRFIKGPIFTNMLLADEINRTPPKTQAALLESMQEHQVTVANHVFPLPPPFFVLATQNPLEQEGTYPLPEAQLDRFMFNIIVDYPDEAEEEAVIEATTIERDAEPETVITASRLLALQKSVRELPVSKHIIKYTTRFVRATRPANERAPDFIKQYVYCGAGPRAAQYLILGAKAKAILHGRVNVSCEDIRSLALPVLRHRLFTNFTADSEGITPDTLIKRLLDSIPEPSNGDYS